MRRTWRTTGSWRRSGTAKCAWSAGRTRSIRRSAEGSRCAGRLHRKAPVRPGVPSRPIVPGANFKWTVQTRATSKNWPVAGDGTVVARAPSFRGDIAATSTANNNPAHTSTMAVRVSLKPRDNFRKFRTAPCNVCCCGIFTSLVANLARDREPVLHFSQGLAILATGRTLSESPHDVTYHTSYSIQ